MASITTLLSTDSLSSSRIVLNDNFAAINNEVNEIAGLLDVSAQTLTLTGSINAGSLNVAVSGGSNLFVVNSSDIIASVPVTLEDSLVLEAGLSHSISNGITTMPAANSYAKTTYIVDASVLSGINAVAAGNDGQDVTFIAANADFTIDSTNIAGVTQNIIVATNGTVTLRYSVANSLWYVISYANANVQF